MLSIDHDSAEKLDQYVSRLCKLILIAALFLLVNPGHASATRSSVSFCFNDWPPFASKTTDGAEGISITIIDEAAKRFGKEAIFEELPWNRSLQKVKDGEIDAVIDAAERSEFIQGPASFSIFSDTFWVREDSGIMNYSDITGGKVGLVDGYKYTAPILPPFSVDQLFVSFNQEKAEIHRQFDQMFTELQKERFIDTVYRQYPGTSYSELLKIN